MTSSDPPPWGRGRSGRYLALTAVLGLALASAAAEAGLRLRWTPPSCLFDVSVGLHPVYRVAPLPWAMGSQVAAEYSARFAHSGLGWRNGIDAERGAGRVLVLGDSQTYGLGVDQGATFADRVEARLAGVDVVNAGVNGYGTRDQLAVLCSLGRAWRPDLCVLVFFWNDVEDNLKRSEPAFALDADGRPQPVAARVSEFDPLAEAPPGAPAGGERKCAPGSYLGRFLKECLRGVRYRTVGIKRRAIRDEEQLELAWRETVAVLEQVAAECRAIGSELLVVALPNQTQVDPRQVIVNIEPINYDVQDRLAAECETLGIDLFDLRAGLREAAERSEGPLFYYADRHLTAAGHAAVADLLGPQLESRFGP